MGYVLVHYSEIGLKGKNRSFFENKLINNIKLSLKSHNVKKIYGRIIIEYENSDAEEIKKILSETIGISNYSFAEHCKNEIGEMKRIILEIAKKESKNTFRISAKRSYDRFKVKSIDVNKEVGEYIIKNTGMKVDLTNPGINFRIEITEAGSFIYTEKHEGLGGLPVGVSGKLVSLISGGIDSPVSSFKMMKRGCKIIFVHFHNYTQSKNFVKDKVKKLVSILSRFQNKSKLYLIPFEPAQKQIIANIPAKYRMIIYRRLMLKIAETILKKENAKGFVTGDSLAQVASQTLENLNVIHDATSYPIFSPLIGDDKQEIINLAEKIKTYQTSILPYPDCCSFLVSEHPETKADLSTIKKLEENLDIKIIDETKAELKFI